MGRILGTWTVRRKLMAGFLGAALLVWLVGGIGWRTTGTFVKSF